MEASLREFLRWERHAVTTACVMTILIAECLSNKAAFGQSPGASGASPFNYDAGASLDVTQISASVHKGVTVRDITYTGTNGATNPAYLVIPEGMESSRQSFGATG
jgi:hypothetical protein